MLWPAGRRPGSCRHRNDVASARRHENEGVERGIPDFICSDAERTPIGRQDRSGLAKKPGPPGATGAPSPSIGRSGDQVGGHASSVQMRNSGAPTGGRLSLEPPVGE